MSFCIAAPSPMISGARSSLCRCRSRGRCRCVACLRARTPHDDDAAQRERDRELVERLGDHVVDTGLEQRRRGRDVARAHHRDHRRRIVERAHLRRELGPRDHDIALGRREVSACAARDPRPRQRRARVARAHVKATPGLVVGAEHQHPLRCTPRCSSARHDENRSTRETLANRQPGWRPGSGKRMKCAGATLAETLLIDLRMSRALYAVLAFSALVGALPACTDDTTPPTIEGETHIATYWVGERHPPQIDVLFVIDDTTAMAPWQDRIAELPTVVESALGSIEGGFQDLRIAVTTNGGALRTTPGIAEPYLFVSRNPDGTYDTNFSGTLHDALAPFVAVGADEHRSEPAVACRRTRAEQGGSDSRERIHVPRDGQRVGRCLARIARVLRVRVQGDARRIRRTSWCPGSIRPARRGSTSFTRSFSNRNTRTALDTPDWSGAFALVAQLEPDDPGPALLPTAARHRSGNARRAVRLHDVVLDRRRRVEGATAVRREPSVLGVRRRHVRRLHGAVFRRRQDPRSTSITPSFAASAW